MTICRNAKILRNKKLENQNLELSSQLNKLLVDIEDTKNTNNKLKAEEKDIILLIKKNNDNALSSDEKVNTNLFTTNIITDYNTIRRCMLFFHIYTFYC